MSGKCFRSFPSSGSPSTLTWLYPLLLLLILCLLLLLLLLFLLLLISSSLPRTAPICKPAMNLWRTICVCICGCAAEEIFVEPQRNICGRRAEIFLTPSRNLQLVATNISVWQLFNPHWKLSNEHYCETVADIL